MDVGFLLKKENPKNGANIFSKLFFTWMVKLLYKGVKKGLEIQDLFKVLKSDKSETLTNKLEKAWDEELNKTKMKNSSPSLLWAFAKTFIWEFMLYGILLFIQYMILRSFQPVVLAYLIRLYNGSEDHDITSMYLLSALLVGLSILVLFLMHHTDLGLSCVGMRVRIAVSSLIYRKILKLNSKSLGQTAAGQVVNLLSNDVNRFDMVTTFWHFFWIIPFQVILVSYLIWMEVGISSLAGVLSMAILSLPVQGYLGKLTSQLRLNIAKKTDFRVKLMSEVISGIQVIKMYAWEKPFEQMIKLARKNEIHYLRHSGYLRGVFLSCMVFIERATLFLTITCYVLLGNNITADKVFSLAQFFNVLQLAMAIQYPQAITYSAESIVSIKRLQEFLMLEEKKSSAIEKIPKKEILLENVEASWTSEHATLKKLNLKVPEATLCAIVGQVGAGKSSILQLLLGELSPNCGSIKIGGEISYASQEAWLFVASVRNNILFGQEYNRVRYKNVVKVCSLEKDFEQFPQGDKTIVGERGVSLSGGQRARINLARAVYRQADVYLLDDPLSAVDTHVGKHLYEECILKYLKGKTRVLVTHQLQYLKKADNIVVLNQGKIEAQGTFEELSETNTDFSDLLVATDETLEKEDLAVKHHLVNRRQSAASVISAASEIFEANYEDTNEEETESLGLSPFKEYIKASGSCWAIIFISTIFVLGQILCSCADYWVTFWTQEEAIRQANDPVKTLNLINLNDRTILQTNGSNYSYKIFEDWTDEITNDEVTYSIIKTNIAIYIYTVFILALIIVTLLRSLVYFKMAMTASKNLHTNMFHTLLKAPMKFFNTNPSGRVLNRFSKDMGAIDELLPRGLLDALQIFLVMSGILVMIIVANYYMVIALLVLGPIFLLLRRWYIVNAKYVKHLEGITKSPVFSHLNSSLNGITTIRASGAEEMLIKEFDEHQDSHTSAWYLTITTRVAFGLWLDLICVIFVAVIAFSFVVLNEYTDVSASMVGLALSQSLILTGMLQYGMRQTAEVVNQLTSVERVLHYTKLDDETLSSINGKLPTLLWPDKGLVEFKHLYLRYSEIEAPVLKDLNIRINPGNKIGIVGRTGAGKSSLISALFRLAPIEGKIFIDNVDTKELKLSDLRRRISIIPQEPVLFSATLRYNLDPFNEFEDAKLWNALEEVELKDLVNNLDFVVSEGGGNFSLGQRQLLCLARAILRNNKILILDEATANVDPRTDSLIQATIRRKFESCTVLTIAHRLNTIMDSDKVLVMESGRMVEFDHPHVLLQNPDGYFHKMVLETGPSMAQQLKQISHNFYLSTIKEV